MTSESSLSDYYTYEGGGSSIGDNTIDRKE